MKLQRCVTDYEKKDKEERWEKRSNTIALTLFKAIILIVIYSVDVFCSSPTARNDENKNRSVYDIIFAKRGKFRGNRRDS